MVGLAFLLTSPLLAAESKKATLDFGNFQREIMIPENLCQLDPNTPVGSTMLEGLSNSLGGGAEVSIGAIDCATLTDLNNAKQGVVPTEVLLIFVARDQNGQVDRVDDNRLKARLLGAFEEKMIGHRSEGNVDWNKNTIRLIERAISENKSQIFLVEKEKSFVTVAFTVPPEIEGTRAVTVTIASRIFHFSRLISTMFIGYDQNIQLESFFDKFHELIEPIR